MSTKTSSLNTPSATVTSTGMTATVAAAVVTNSSAMSAIKIKKELPSDEIKEFAENTMNELLGWYGFDDMDRLDLSSKTTRLLHSAAAAKSNSMPSQHPMEKRRSRGQAITLLQVQQQNDHIKKINNNSSTHNNIRRRAMHCNSYRGSGSGSGNGSGLGHGGGNDSTNSDHDTRSSREDDSKSPHLSAKTTVEEKIDFSDCCWCRRPVPENAPEFLTTCDGPRYCSESCFTQSRRASFKKAKTCDWCKHVRHAVSYVDFQDGASQLQFCSDKCLNQYKMQIFCKETQAHLDMNPHLCDQGFDAVAAANGAGLITPDLWLRNCRSRSASPASTASVSPGPASAMPISPPGMAPHSGAPASKSTPVVHKPLISVAPVSKLMSKSMGIMQNRHSQKHCRKKRPLRSCAVGGADVSPGTGLKSNNLVGVPRDLSALANSGTAGISGKTGMLLLSTGAKSNLHTSPGTQHATTGKYSATPLSQFAGSSVQDLHMSVPPLSPMLEQQQLSAQHLHTHPHVLPHAATASGGHGGTSIPTSFFATPPNAPAPPTHAQLSAPSNGFPPRLPSFLLPNTNNIPNTAVSGLLPRFGPGFGLTHMPPLSHQDMTGWSTLLGATPPVTVMVPYPIIIPLPIPIPVPLPIMDFYKAHQSAEQRNRFGERGAEKENEEVAKLQQRQKEIVAQDDQQRQREDGPTEREAAELCATSEEPLDFTKSKDLPLADEKRASDENVQSNVITTLKDEIPPAADFEEPVTDANIICTEDSDSPAATTSVIHCIVSADNIDQARQINSNAESAMGDIDKNTEGEGLESEDAKQKLPKFKITRLQTKRTLIQAKEAECSRPLRKRKRIIDCDFQKVTLRDAELDAEYNDAAAGSKTMLTSAAPTSPTASNSNTRVQINKK